MQLLAGLSKTMFVKFLAQEVPRQVLTARSPTTAGYVGHLHLPAPLFQPRWRVVDTGPAGHGPGVGRVAELPWHAPQVAAEYFKNTTLLLVGVICVAAAVEKWNLHKRIALRMVLMAGAKPGM